jgi:SnoaL-like domain
MQKSTFIDYLDAYNAGDMDRAFSFYDPEIIFENFGRHQQGKAATDFLRSLHGVISDRMNPRYILIDGDNIALEADCIITAHMDLPELPVGAMRKGEQMNVRTFAFYKTRGDHILHIRVAGWPGLPVS